MSEVTAPPVLAARQTLKDVFGFETFRPGQEAVVSRLLEGRSVLAIFPRAPAKAFVISSPPSPLMVSRWSYRR